MLVRFFLFSTFSGILSQETFFGYAVRVVWFLGEMWGGRYHHHEKLACTVCKRSFIARKLLRFGTGAILFCLYLYCLLSCMCIRQTRFFLLVLNNFSFIITINLIYICILLINCFCFLFPEYPFPSTNTANRKKKKFSGILNTWKTRQRRS